MNNQEAVLLTRLREKYGQVKQTSNGWLRIACPTCLPKDQRKFKRYIRPDTLYNHCFICEKRLRQDELLGDSYIHVRPSPAELLASDEQKENPMARKMPGTRFVPVHHLPADHPAVRFLHKDHLFDLRRYYEEQQVVFCPADAGMIFARRPFISSAERLIFPVKFNGDLVGWQMRSIPGTVYGDRPDVVKYYHLFPKGKYLYNYDNARKYETVVLTEGVKKALKLPNGVASFGKGISGQQVRLLSQWNKVIICYDSEPAAQETGQSIVSSLSQYGVRAINVDLMKYGAPSPDEMTEEQLQLALYNECREHGWFAQ